MRRREREITDREEINSVLLECDCCRVGFCDGGRVYIVPMNFGFAEEQGQRVIYFHGAGEGRKAELIKGCPTVGFEMDCGHSVKFGANACEHSFSYKSIIGSGVISFVTDPDRKHEALELIMRHYTAKEGWQFAPEMLSRTAVMRLCVQEISCKINK